MTLAATDRKRRPQQRPSLNWGDRLLLIGGSVLFSLMSFAVQSLAVPWLLRFTLAEVLSNDLIRQSAILKRLGNSDIGSANPTEQPLRIWPGALPPLSSHAISDPTGSLVLSALAQRGIRETLQCQPLEPFKLYCGYWLRVRTTGPAAQTYWVYSAPSRAMPWLWPLIRNSSLLLGCGIAVLVFLHWRLQRPMRLILNRLPVIPSSELESVPERGMGTVRELSIRINRCFEVFNQQQETRRRFLQGLAHDFGSPLTRLSMRLEDAELAGDTAAALTQALPELREDLNRLISLTHLLQQSAGHPEEPFRLITTSVDELCERVAGSYPSCRIQLRVGRRMARLDPVLIERALVNLIDNAMAYGREPIRMSASAQAGCLKLRVEDSGSGLASPSQLSLPQIACFDDREQGKRVGLGLAIVERCCRLHNGRLVLGHSALGGLLVELQLPQG
jgi:signal transduction histidine kinase